MLAKRKIISNSKFVNNFYKFHKNDTVKITTSKHIKDAVIKGRYSIKGVNYYKVGNSINTIICKEIELIHR